MDTARISRHTLPVRHFTEITQASTVYLVDTDTQRDRMRSAGLWTFNVCREWHAGMFAGSAHVNIVTEDHVNGRKWGYDILRALKVAAAENAKFGFRAKEARLTILGIPPGSAPKLSRSGVLIGSRTVWDSSWLDRKDDDYTYSFGFEPVDYSKLEDRPHREQFVCDPLPVGGVGILSGLAKAGKSTLLCKLAAAVSNGEPFLGRETKAGLVLYCAFEGNRDVVRRDLRDAGARYGRVIDYVGRKPANRTAALIALAEAIAVHDPVLIIIDTMQKMIDCSNLNSYEAGEAAMDPFVNLAANSGVALMFSHHDEKSGRGHSGAEVLKGSCDAYLHLSKENGGRRVLTSENRAPGTPFPPTVITLDGSSSEIVADRQTQRKESVAGAVIEVLKSGKQPKSQVKGRIPQFKGGEVDAAVTVLAANGTVKQTGGGVRGNPYLLELVSP